MSYKRITKEKFNTLKTAATPLDKIMSRTKISSILGTSRSTIQAVLRNDTFEDYKAEQKRWFDAMKEKKAKKQTTTNTNETLTAPVEVVPAPAEPINQFDTKLLNENLVLMAEKFERFTKALEENTIATYSLRKSLNTLYGSDSKRKWF